MLDTRNCAVSFHTGRRLSSMTFVLYLFLPTNTTQKGSDFPMMSVLGRSFALLMCTVSTPSAWRPQQEREHAR